MKAPVIALRSLQILGVSSAFVVGVGCSSGGKDGDNLNDTDVRDSGDTDTSDSGTTPAPPPTYWSLGGTVVLTAGVPDLGLSQLEVATWETDPLQTTCTEIRTLASAEPAILEEAALPIYGWWTLVWAEGSTCDWVPEGLLLGIGAPDLRLAPALERAGLADSTGYAAYAQWDATQPIFVFGIAGNEAQFEGTEPPVAAGPLPDGALKIQTLHLLPVP